MTIEDNQTNKETELEQTTLELNELLKRQKDEKNNLIRENEFFKEVFSRKINKRQRNRLLLLSSMLFVLAVILLIVRADLDNVDSLRTVLLLALSLFATGCITLLYVYLEYNTKTFDSDNENADKIENRPFNYGLTESEIIFDSDLNNSKKRIINEIQRLTKSANLNLAVGSVITGAIVFFLGYEVITQTIKHGDTLDLLYHYIPRLSLMIFAEIFAFFFLKVYKSNLNDIKYFHNELTNTELKFIGVRVAKESKKEDFLKSAIEQLLITERNFVLKKDETTIEIQKERIQLANNRSIIDALKDVIKIGK